MEIVGLFSTWRAWSSKCGGTIGGREVRINGFPPNNSSNPPPTSHPLHKGRQAKKKGIPDYDLKNARCKGLETTSS